MARKAPKNKLTRVAKNLQPRAKILIVCEGEKTEKEYFEYLKRIYRLNTAEVRVKSDGGSSPNTVFNDALKLFEESTKRNNIEYDEVYCVYDCDEFSKHAQVKSKIQQQKSFSLIFSNPCFEVWYLFHFNASSKPFAKKGSKTASQQLKSHVNKLLKNSSNHLQVLIDKTDEAIKNARMNDLQNIENPYTNVYKLVERLIELKR